MCEDDPFLVYPKTFCDSCCFNHRCTCSQRCHGNSSKRVALVSPQRATELIGIYRMITDEKGNKSHTSITFIHSLKRHSLFHPAGFLWNAAIVTLSDECTLRILLGVLCSADLYEILSVLPENPNLYFPFPQTCTIHKL